MIHSPKFPSRTAARAFSFASSIIAIHALPAAAQSGPSEQALGQVVVTAARIEQLQADALPHTTVISAADIRNHPAADLPALLAAAGDDGADGEVLVALQTVQAGGDASRDVAQALLAALECDPGTPVGALPPATTQTPRLQDLLAPGELDVQVHDDFDFWVAPDVELDEAAKASLADANASIVPTTKLGGVPSAYWCRIGERTHVRWILPHEEDAATDALARLHAAGEDLLGEGTRLLGAFRAAGLLCPVWDLDPAKEAADYEEPMAALAELFDAALTEEALTPEQRRAKSGLLSRQLTLR